MSWRRYLQVKSRDPAALWRMVIAILSIGVGVGLAVDWAVPAWIHVERTADGGLEPTDDPDVEPSPDAGGWRRLEALAQRGEWLQVALGIPREMVKRWGRPGLTALAVLTGACWLAFAMQAIQPRGRVDLRRWGPPAAIVLGVVSIWPTLFLLMYQEHRWDVVESDELIGGIRFFLVGVGFREELSKFVCFLPLLPLAVRARDELAALLLAGCVGLGFAMEENVSYIAGSGGASTIARLLMPAPFHMATTGLVGLAAYRACRWPREWGPLFFATFGVIVLAHAAYDSFLSLPALADFAIAAQIIFILLMYQFFRELRPLQEKRNEPISLTANFLFCVSTVAAATFVYLCAAIGWRPAAQVMSASVLGDAVIVYLFLREMPETMVKV